MIKRILPFIAAMFLAAPAVDANQIKCVVQVPAAGIVHLYPYEDPRCEVIGGPIDCLHFVLYAAGNRGYISFMTPKPEGGWQPGTALWAPSPGWFHSPQMPIDETGFTRINVQDGSGVTHNARIVIRGHPGPCD